MKLLVYKNLNASLWTNVHGNSLEKANEENIKHKLVAGVDKDGNLYVYKKKPKPMRYKKIKIYGEELGWVHDGSNNLCSFTLGMRKNNKI